MGEHAVLVGAHGRAVVVAAGPERFVEAGAAVAVPERRGHQRVSEGFHGVRACARRLAVGFAAVGFVAVDGEDVGAPVGIDYLAAHGERSGGSVGRRYGHGKRAEQQQCDAEQARAAGSQRGQRRGRGSGWLVHGAPLDGVGPLSSLAMPYPKKSTQLQQKWLPIGGAFSGGGRQARRAQGARESERGSVRALRKGRVAASGGASVWLGVAALSSRRLPAKGRCFAGRLTERGNLRCFELVVRGCVLGAGRVPFRVWLAIVGQAC